jgi:hypothetical protein
MQSRSAIGPILVVAVMLPTLLGDPGIIVPVHQPGYTPAFMLEECEGFSSSGRNPFFVLEPGYQLILEGEEEGEIVRLIITVLHQTQTIDGIETRVVQEKETQEGELVEISRNYFALCNRNNSVVYFGEDVDFYKNGDIVSHGGSWRAGVNGASPGIIMPGIVLLGARYFQEVAPEVALDRAEIVSLNDVVQTPAGTFDKCLQTKETTPLEPAIEEFKWYAPGIGLVQDGILKLKWVESSNMRAEGDEDERGVPTRSVPADRIERSERSRSGATPPAHVVLRAEPQRDAP